MSRARAGLEALAERWEKNASVLLEPPASVLYQREAAALRRCASELRRTIRDAIPTSDSAVPTQAPEVSNG